MYKESEKGKESRAGGAEGVASEAEKKNEN